MSVTLADIKRQFPTADSVKQVGSKQLFVVSKTKFEFLISYNTIVGCSEVGTSTWYVTDRKYSVTTTHQVNSFLRQVAVGKQIRVLSVDARILESIDIENVKSEALGLR